MFIADDASVNRTLCSFTPQRTTTTVLRRAGSCSTSNITPYCVKCHSTLDSVHRSGQLGKSSVRTPVPTLYRHLIRKVSHLASTLHCSMSRYIYIPTMPQRGNRSLEQSAEWDNPLTQSPSSGFTSQRHLGRLLYWCNEILMSIQQCNQQRLVLPNSSNYIGPHT